MKQKIILLFTTLLIFFILTEITFTFLVTNDLDGNMSFNYVHLKPYKLPILETQKKIDELTKHKVPDSLLQNDTKSNFNRSYFNVRLIPSKLLGWLPSPIYKSDNGLYIYNADGIRCNNILTSYSEKKELRIAIFGDSYSHGDEVKFENTIGNYLESLLLNEGIDAEVINFAVSGYGMDQAFLRWQQINEEFNPDIVILGVQFENVKRHINLLRPFYYYITEIPYSKPRFLIQGNKLQLISNPINDVTKTANIIEHFNEWEFSNFEGFYSQDKYQSNPFYYSKTISFTASAISQIFDEINYYKPESESYQVTYKLFEKFKRNVAERGKIFIPVHLPVKNDFDFLTQKFLSIAYDQTFIYDELFNALRRKANFVETYNALHEWTLANGNNGLFMKRHYSPTANKIIAHQIFSYLINKHHQFFTNLKQEQ
jgi:hypothetical protein